MHIFQTAFVSASWAVYLLSITPFPLLIVLLYLCNMTLLLSFWNENTLRDVTSVLYPGRKQRNSLVLFRQPRFQWSPSQENQEGSGSCKTYHFHFTRPLQYALSILPLTLTYTHAPGARLPPYVSSSGRFHLGRKQQFATWPRLTEQSLSTLPNGQVWSLEPGRTPLPLTPASVLASLPPLERTARSQMQELTSSGHKGSVRYRNGWTTTYSSGSCVSTSRATTQCARFVLPSLQGMGECSWMGGAGGIAVPPYQTGESRNLMKTLSFPSSTYRKHPRVLQKTLCLPSASTTSTVYPKSWESHGNWLRTFCLPRALHSSAISGTSRRIPFQSLPRRRKSTWQRYRNGKLDLRTPCSKSRSYTESFYMSPWSFLQDGLTSPPSKKCFPSSIIVRTCFVPPPSTQAKISAGGEPISPCQSSLDPSQGQSRSLNPRLTQTLAQVLASRYGSTADGGHGASSQAGKTKTETSAGRRQSVWNSLLSHSSINAQKAAASKFSATTEVSSRAGGKDEAGTGPQTPYSNGSMSSRCQPSARSSPATCQASTTQRTVHPGASTHHESYYSLRSPFPNPSKPSSQTLTIPKSLLSVIGTARESKRTRSSMTVLEHVSSPPISTMSSVVKEKKCSKRRKLSKLANHLGGSIPHKFSVANYPHNLTPITSSLRPHCSAKDRLRLWRPAANDSSSSSLPHIDAQRIQDVMIHAWASSTREAYGSGILAFHVYCDSKNIEEHLRAPAPSEIISAFISDMAGSYSGKTISSYIHGVRAWHILHGRSWSLDDNQIDTLLKAAKNLTPSSSKRKKRPPYTIAFITSILQKLNPDDPLDAAVGSCLTTAFYSVARAGEFTIQNLSSFDPSLHVKRSDIRQEADRNGLATTVFHLPRTKTSQTGEDVFWARQEGPTDPDAALSNHFRINNPHSNIALFSYKFGNSHRPLTKTKFIGRLARAARDAGLDPLQGHAIRIGTTLEYLLRNVPFDVVKTMGHWASDAFQIYLRNHAQILAPYLQATPALQDEFLRLTMPRIR